jgi:Tol biopolymer transport system component/imidazolonepropionase-like amidohydrolase
MTWAALAATCLLSAAAGGAVAAGDAVAADTQSEWDVSAPPGDSRSIDIDVREGTWMSLDVSPDGERIVFDLLGDIYVLPIDGGDARSLTSGLAWDMQPRFSPDGKRIAFTSDRAGGDNVWVMNADGSEPRQITEEDFRLLNNAVWHPDGDYLAARKHYTTRRSLGTGEIWLYSPRGGAGVPVVERPSPDFQKELGEPAFSPDGRYLYYTQNVTPGDRFEYAQDTNREIFQIRRRELTSGDVEPVATGPGGAVRPTPSPDGRYLAFVGRDRAAESFDTALWVMDLRSGRERILYRDLDRDMQETWGVQGLYPNMAWTPDSQAIVFWAQGRINRVNVESGAIAEIPFRVQDTREALVPPRFAVEVAPDQVRSRMPRFARVSPDGQRVVFEAFGRLWLQKVDGGEPRRLTRDPDAAFELFPSFSADGRRIVYVRWTDAGLGQIHTVAAGGGRASAVTEQPGHYRSPRFGPDGETLVFERASGGYLTGPEWSLEPGIYRMPADGGAMVRLTESGRDPHFTASGERIYFTRDLPRSEEQPAHELVSMDLNGTDPRVHASSNYATRIQVSPGGDWIAFRENYHVYVLPMPPGGKVDLSRDAKALPLARASTDGGEFLDWTDADTVSWTLGPELYQADTGDLFPEPAPARAGGAEAAAAAAAGGAAATESTTADQPPRGTRVATLSVTRPADKPSGSVALTGARVITMDDDRRVLEPGTVLIRDNRIAAVGAAGEVEVPADAQRIDLAGRTVLPGLIDIHAHGSQGVDDLIPQQNWLAIAHLALGVTTTHDPSNRASEIFAAAEYQRAGVITAPRLFSTGEIIYGARSEVFAHIDDLEDAREHVRRLAAQGAIAVKNYNQPRRDQRQMVVTAAREAGLMVVAEGASLYHMDMNLIADGNTGIEHNVPPETFYADMLQFWPETGVGYTPTLVVTYGGLRGEDWFYQNEDVWRHGLLSRFVPPHVLEPRAVRRQLAPRTDYQPFIDAADNARKLMERGVLVNIGAHGQREGLASHWEIWGFAMGGMSPMQALATATINPARYLGLDGDIGSIEAGKLADLLVVDGNPLVDIRTTDDVAYVVLNGRVLEGGSLAETVTGDRTLAPFYWQN